MSESGKTAGETVSAEDVAASFQAAVVEVLVEKSMRAVKQLGHRKLVMAGGVAANSCLREELQKACGREGIRLYVPPAALCTDNAAMIGSAAYFAWRGGETADLTLDARASVPLGEIGG